MKVKGGKVARYTVYAERALREIKNFGQKPDGEEK
jgi:hypothetical protein